MAPSRILFRWLFALAIAITDANPSADCRSCTVLIELAGPRFLPSVDRLAAGTGRLRLRGGWSLNPVSWFEDAVESAVKDDVGSLLHPENATAPEASTQAAAESKGPERKGPEVTAQPGSAKPKKGGSWLNPATWLNPVSYFEDAVEDAVKQDIGELIHKEEPATSTSLESVKETSPTQVGSHLGTDAPSCLRVRGRPDVARDTSHARRGMLHSRARIQLCGVRSPACARANARNQLKLRGYLSTLRLVCSTQPGTHPTPPPPHTHPHTHTRKHSRTPTHMRARTQRSRAHTRVDRAELTHPSPAACQRRINLTSAIVAAAPPPSPLPQPRRRRRRRGRRAGPVAPTPRCPPGGWWLLLLTGARIT